MFLNLLNDEEKKIFLQLAISVIQADGKVEETEKAYIADYCREMKINQNDLEKVIDPMPLIEKISNNSSESVKRIFLLELLACANSDGNFADIEKALIVTFVKKSGLPDSLLDDCWSLLQDYSRVSLNMMSFIQGVK